MKQQKTVESRVLEILKECPMSRYDDMLLILHYYRARQRVQSLFPEYSRNPQKEEQSGSISIVINIS